MGELLEIALVQIPGTQPPSEKVRLGDDGIRQTRANEERRSRLRRGAYLDHGRNLQAVDTVW